jgi:aminopeptidase N
MQLYSSTLGYTNIPGGTIKHVYSPKRKGQGKAGIALPGMIVTSEGLTMEALARDPQFSLFQGIAHEIAHYWWNFGADQGDWINEAFAEYYSAIAVEKLSSEAEYQAVLADYRKQAIELPAHAPPLATVPVMEPSSFVIRYYKGSLMLDALRQVLGDAKFFQASRDFFQRYTGKPAGTPEFRDFWKERMGDRKDLIDLWLDSKGGPPRRS